MVHSVLMKQISTISELLRVEPPLDLTPCRLKIDVPANVKEETRKS